MAQANENNIPVISEQVVRNKIYMFRGLQVMIDSDLADIYGYTTKDFNRQVKNNKEKFDEDFMFQLNDEETEILRSRKLTSSWGGSRYNHNAFTEQGIYMLMTVLKGELATKQSKALIRMFKAMKEYIIGNQALLGQRDYLQLSIQTTQNTQDILEMKESLSSINDKVASVVDQLGCMVTKSELSELLLDFGKPAVKYGWLILNGQPIESDLAYTQIYGNAKETIFVIDNYIGLKTLVLLKGITSPIKVTVFSDNLNGGLHLAEYNDFCKEYPQSSIKFLQSGNKFHDRYIVLDYNTKGEIIYHCGASSKDGGNRVTTISQVNDASIYHNLIESILNNKELKLK